MDKVIKLSSSEYFELDKYLKKDVRFYVLTGARGCGKTVSMLNKCKEFFKQNKVCLYIRNSKSDLATARQYFSYLADERHIINLGGLGANTIVLQSTEDREDKRLIGYTLFINDYETFKSSKRKVDYIIYEEFSSFTSGVIINRVFSLTELMESIRQTNHDFMFFAISNNIFKDTLFDNLLNSKDFIHYQIIKENNKNNFINNAIQRYLNGDYIVPDITINMSKYKCQGFVEVAGIKVFVYKNINLFPVYVLSSKGTGEQLLLNFDTISIIKQASYRSLTDRNALEFAVGLICFANKKLKI